MTAKVPRLLGIFFAFATLMCAGATWSLLDPQGPAAAIWRVKPQQYRQMLAMGPIVAFGFLFLTLIMAVTSIGCFTSRRWGWGLAVALIGINALADGARTLTGEFLEGAIGVIIAGGVLLFLVQRRVREIFRK